MVALAESATAAPRGWPPRGSRSPCLGALLCRCWGKCQGHWRQRALVVQAPPAAGAASGNEASADAADAASMSLPSCSFLCRQAPLPFLLCLRFILLLCISYPPLIPHPHCTMQPFPLLLLLPDSVLSAIASVLRGDGPDLRSARLVCKQLQAAVDAAVVSLVCKQRPPAWASSMPAAEHEALIAASTADFAITAAATLGEGAARFAGLAQVTICAQDDSPWGKPEKTKMAMTDALLAGPVRALPRGLTSLTLRECALGPTSCAALAERCPRLQSLACGADAYTEMLLALSPCLRNLGQALPRLCRLKLDALRYGVAKSSLPAGTAALLATGLPQLQELRLARTNLCCDELTALATMRLSLLAIKGFKHGSDIRASASLGQPSAKRRLLPLTLRRLELAYVPALDAATLAAVIATGPAELSVDVHLGVEFLSMQSQYALLREHVPRFAGIGGLSLRLRLFNWACEKRTLIPSLARALSPSVGRTLRSLSLSVDCQTVEDFREFPALLPALEVLQLDSPSVFCERGHYDDDHLVLTVAPLLMPLPALRKLVLDERTVVPQDAHVPPALAALFHTAASPDFSLFVFTRAEGEARLHGRAFDRDAEDAKRAALKAMLREVVQGVKRAGRPARAWLEWRTDEGDMCEVRVA